MVNAQGYAGLVDSERGLGEDTPRHASSPEREGQALRIEPGKEEEFAYVRGWLASSEWLDKLIAAAETGRGPAGLEQAEQARREERDQMFSILDEATIQAAVVTREDEVRRLLIESEARRKERASEQRVWLWRVEPGMEETFENLRGWLLHGARHAPVEMTALSRGSDARLLGRAHSMPAGVRCRRQRTTFRVRLPSVLGSARLPVLRISRRLLQWNRGTQPRGRASSKLEE